MLPPYRSRSIIITVMYLKQRFKFIFHRYSWALHALSVTYAWLEMKPTIIPLIDIDLSLTKVASAHCIYISIHTLIDSASDVTVAPVICVIAVPIVYTVPLCVAIYVDVDQQQPRCRQRVLQPFIFSVMKRCSSLRIGNCKYQFAENSLSVNWKLFSFIVYETRTTGTG